MQLLLVVQLLVMLHVRLLLVMLRVLLQLLCDSGQARQHDVFLVLGQAACVRGCCWRHAHAAAAGPGAAVCGRGRTSSTCCLAASASGAPV
jgi:hypothetical protein